MSLKLCGLGICTHFYHRDAGWKAEHLVPLADEMGVSLVRDEILWEDTEKEKGFYSISQVHLDWMQRVTDAGMGINMLLCYGNKIYENPLDPKAFANYAGFIARELAGKYNIVSFEIWNEPYNFQFMSQYGGSWNGKEPCLWLEKFSELVTETAAVLKKEAPQVPLIVSPGEPQFYHMTMRYPQSLAQIDAVGIHPYPSRFPPETVPWGGQQIYERDGISVADDDHSYLSMWRRLQECCKEYLGRELALYATEWGYPTHDHNLRGTHFAGYTDEAQAIYTVRGLILSMAAGVESLYIYDFMDDGIDRYEQEDNFGLVRNEVHCFERKPSWYAVRRLVEWLTPDWEYLKQPPAELMVDINPLPHSADLWKHPVKEPHICINSPQSYWFITGNDLVCFIWHGGKISGEYCEPIGSMQWDQAPEFRRIEMYNMFTGRYLPCKPAIENGKLIIPEVPVGTSPVAIRWMPSDPEKLLYRLGLKK